MKPNPVSATEMRAAEPASSHQPCRPAPRRSLPRTEPLPEPTRARAGGGEPTTNLQEFCGISLALKYREAEGFITPLVSRQPSKIKHKAPRTYKGSII